MRVGDLQNHLLRHQPDILHFSGHGSKANEIILEDEFGNSRPIPTHALSRLFSLLKDNIRCVVLNACYSEQQAQAIAEHIDCVIGMSKAISDTAAVSFATAFYQALGYGRDIETAFELGCTQIDLEDLCEQDTPRLLAVNTDPQKVFLVHATGFKDEMIVSTADEQRERSHQAMWLLQRSHGWSGQPSYGFIDPGVPFVTTVAELIERAISAATIPEKEATMVGPEMFKFYQLLVRMKKNCAWLRIILESSFQVIDEKTNIFEQTDIHNVVEDQSQTVFALFELLITRADLFEIFIPGFPVHLWGLLNCREGVLRSIISGYTHSETSVELLVKVDKEAKETGLEWTPYFDDYWAPEYHPKLNQAYGVDSSHFVAVDLSSKDERASQYVIKHLKKLETSLEIIADRFAKLIRENFKLRELVGQ